MRYNCYTCSNNSYTGSSFDKLLFFAESAHKTIQENSYFYTRTDVILIIFNVTLFFPHLCEYISVAMQQRIYCFSEKKWFTPDILMRVSICYLLLPISWDMKHYNTSL